MKIAFYTAMFPVIRETYQSPQMLGFGYLSSYLKQKFPGLEIELRHDEEELLAEHADIVGITCVTYTYGKAREAARKAKERYGAVTVVGGPHVTALPERLDAEFDYAVLGEGEETFAQLVEQLRDCNPPREPEKIDGLVFWRDGERVVNAPRELVNPLDTLPHPDRELFGGRALFEGSSVSIITSRGCPHTCHFCSTTRHWGKRLRLFSADYVADELAEIVGRYRPKVIRFEDDMFVSSGKRLEQIAEKILSGGFHKQVEFHVSARADRVTDDVCRVLEEINTRTVYMGLESIQDHVLETLGKKGITGDVNRRAVQNVARRNMRVIASFIFGVPGETLDDAYETYRFIQQNLDKFHHVEASPLQIFPGTKFWRQAMENGIIEPDLKGVVYDDVDVEDGWFSLRNRFPKLTESMTRGELAAMALAHKELTKHVDERAKNRFLSESLDRISPRSVDAMGFRATAAELLKKGVRRLKKTR